MTDSPPITLIEPEKGWHAIDWGELHAYRDLLRFLVWRDVKVIYQQTVIGFGWAIIRPVTSMIVFTVVFGGLAKVSSDGIPYPVFSYAALLPWTYFSTALTKSTGSLVSYRNMLSKVYFPRVIIPLTPVLAGLVDFLLASVVLLLMMVGYGLWPNAGVLMLPYLVLLMIVTATGCGMWLSAMAVQYRDIQFGMQFMAPLLMYAAPVVWPASLIAQRFGEHGRTALLIYGLYPMAGVIEGFRAALLGQTAMPWELIGMGSLSAFAVFFSGLWYFRHCEQYFADVA